MRRGQLRDGGEGTQRLFGTRTEPQDAAGRIQTAQRGLRQDGGQDEERAQLPEILHRL